MVLADDIPNFPLFLCVLYNLLLYERNLPSGAAGRKTRIAILNPAGTTNGGTFPICLSKSEPIYWCLYDCVDSSVVGCVDGGSRGENTLYNLVD